MEKPSGLTGAAQATAVDYGWHRRGPHTGPGSAALGRHAAMRRCWSRPANARRPPAG